MLITAIVYCTQYGCVSIANVPCASIASVRSMIPLHRFHITVYYYCFYTCLYYIKYYIFYAFDGFEGATDSNIKYCCVL